MNNLKQGSYRWNDKQKKNGFAQLANKVKITLYGIFLLFVICCVHETSTPAEFRYVQLISKEAYKKDLSLLRGLMKVHYDSINSVASPTHVVENLSIKIDTIFYGPDHKISFLVLLSNENNYLPAGIQYTGECYIAYRNFKVTHLYQLKYSSSSNTSQQRACEILREIYLQQMNYIKGEYNINDIRFWNSDVWIEAKQMEKKRKDFEESKRNDPNSVFDPNDVD